MDLKNALNILERATSAVWTAGGTFAAFRVAPAEVALLSMMAYEALSSPQPILGSDIPQTWSRSPWSQERSASFLQREEEFKVEAVTRKTAEPVSETLFLLLKPFHCNCCANRRPG